MTKTVGSHITIFGESLKNAPNIEIRHSFAAVRKLADLLLSDYFSGAS